MEIRFTSNIPADTNPILISGKESLKYASAIYLAVKNNGREVYYEIRLQNVADVFREAIQYNNIIIAGFGDSLYIFDTFTNTEILALPLDGYFGHLYLEAEELYVTNCSGVWCISLNGELKWYSKNLAVDGITINDFTIDEIHISAEIDPPGGWVPLILDRKTGQKIS